MKKPLLLSLAAASIITANLDAQSMYDRIQSMELHMKQMQGEITTLKVENENQAKLLAASDEEDEDEKKVSEDEDDEEASATSDDDEDEEGEDAEDSDEDEDDDEDDEETIDDRVADLEESVTDLNKNTNGSHVKLKVDYRFAVDNIQYKMADESNKGNDAFMTNRLWINMNWKATEHLSFTGQLGYNKAFGARSGSGEIESVNLTV